MKARAIHQDEIRAIYSGDHRRGSLVLKDSEYLAFDRQMRPLGRFSTTHEAVVAVMRASGGTAS
jgi:hypothetical protein